jgi:hypothetical protein
MERREYTDKGLLSKDSMLAVFDDTLSKYVMLVPVVDMPETKSAPATVEKTVLTDHSVKEVEGLQTNDQKTYTFNYHRDNIARIKNYAGRELKLLEINPDMTGERYTGTIKLSRNAIEINGIVQGSMYVTVNDADEFPIEDVRDIVANTAILTTPLNDVTLATTTGTATITLSALPSTATFTVSSSATSICTAALGTGENANKLTITGVAAGFAKVTIVTSATGEASSTRTFLVEVPAAE